MEKGALKQYAAPLEMYDKPSCLFVADFIGVPTMNFIDASLDKENISFCGINGKFISKNKSDIKNDIILGIRPEYISINPKGKITGKVFSTLPAGMETTVKIDVNGTIITAVVFGNVDYKVEKEIKFDINGSSCIIFDKTTTENILMGRIEIE